MPTLYITEFASIAASLSGFGGIPVTMPPVVEQGTLTVGGTVAVSGSFGGSTRLVRLMSDVVCSVAWSAPNAANPAPTTGNMRLAANVEYFYGVTPGMKVAVISNT
jgi:hypothetical protein